MQTIQIRTYGATLVERELIETGERPLSLSPVWEVLFERLEGIEKEQFATDGARGGSPWAPLTIEWLQRKWLAGQRLEINRASDAMYQALTGKTQDSVRLMRQDTAVFGADLDQFRMAQDEAGHADSGVPYRPPIDLTEADALAFANVILSYVVGGTDVLGRRMARRDPRSGRFFS